MTGFRGATSVVVDAYSGNYATEGVVTLAKPTGVVQGDILVAGIGIHSGGSPNDFSSGQTWVMPAGWSLVVGNAGAMFWKIAGASEPSTYSWELRNNFDNSLLLAYFIGLMGAWEGWTSVVSMSLATPPPFGQFQVGSRLSFHTAFNLSFPPNDPHVIDIPSLEMHGTETTATGGLVVSFWMGIEAIENFDGTYSNFGNPPYPGSIPWVTVSPQQTERVQEHFEGLPTGGLEDNSPSDPDVTKLACNMTFAMADQDMAIGTVPDGVADFTWQHAGAEEGFGEFARGFRLAFDAVSIATPYWGINATTRLPL